jgi:hypothetical protein
MRWSAFLLLSLAACGRHGSEFDGGGPDDGGDMIGDESDLVSVPT